MSEVIRCAWAGQNELQRRYHDQEWGVPVYDDRKLFEMLVLEGAQAGLSWNTILNKRAGYRRAFEDFDPERIARYSTRKVEELLVDPGIVRNRLKVQSVVTNARAFQEIRDRHGSFAEYIWGFVDGTPLQNHWARDDEVPANTPQSEVMSKDLRRCGFKFVGATVCYAFMQAVGMVNDHRCDCHRYLEVSQMVRLRS